MGAKGQEERPQAGETGGTACSTRQMSLAELAKLDALPLHSRTPIEWGRAVLAEPISLLIDHAFLEKKAANNAMELLTHWPNDWVEGWVETMAGVARDETAHLAQVLHLLIERGGKLDRTHKNPYANALRLLVRKGEPAEILDRLMVSAIIEVRSCERFALLAGASEDAELAGFYRALYSSEFGHYKVFLKLACKIVDPATVEARWQQMLAAEAAILAVQPTGPRIHSGFPEEAETKS
jgi:tRNA-(ms[2]io[6]A)-hydroxylase